MSKQPYITDRIHFVGESRRVVLKLGTSIIIREAGGVALSRFYSFIESIAAVRRAGREVLLVTSGSVGLGAQQLGIESPLESLPMKQACAAVGQGRLMALYSDAFDRIGLKAAQVLLTEEDFSSRRRYLNLRSTLTKLLDLGVIPVINENDTVSTEELEPEDSQPYRRVNFGDNDKLSALVASKTEADLLLILTDVEGIYDRNPADTEVASVIPTIEEITPDIENLARQPGNRRGGVGRGGIRTKIEAARIATRSGCAVIVAGGKTNGVIDRIFAGEDLGTLFVPQTSLPGKRRWIAFATTVRAALIVNQGAQHALVDGKASLLAAGVIEVRGDFDRGDVVSVLDDAEREFARGIVNYSSDETRKISGMRSEKIDELIENRNYDALITRDNLAILE